MSVPINRIVTYRVSSVINRDVKSFGKKNIFDGKEDTCWNSEKGTPQWISLELDDEYSISGFRIQFQGGFAGRKCFVKFKNISGIEESEPFYPEDNNIAQKFVLNQVVQAKEFTFLFEESTDFFGRIVVYSLELLRI